MGKDVADALEASSVGSMETPDDAAAVAAVRVSVGGAVGSGSASVVLKPLPGSTSAEADRRRAAALSALASRLQLAEAAVAKQAAVGDGDFDSLLPAEDTRPSDAPMK
jgi:hypothetical protein